MPRAAKIRGISGRIYREKLAAAAAAAAAAAVLFFCNFSRSISLGISPSDRFPLGRVNLILINYVLINTNASSQEDVPYSRAGLGPLVLLGFYLGAESQPVSEIRAVKTSDSSIPGPGAVFPCHRGLMGNNGGQRGIAVEESLSASRRSYLFASSIGVAYRPSEISSRIIARTRPCLSAFFSIRAAEARRPARAFIKVKLKQI
jgi:hypothetical protein